MVFLLGGGGASWERTVSQSAIPIRIKQVAVFAFMETQPGKMLFSTVISNAHPMITIIPTNATKSAVPRVNVFADKTEWVVRSVFISKFEIELLVVNDAMPTG